MINNPENIPEFIFDWMKERSFAELNAQEQAMVREHFDPAEYNELHSTMSDIRSGMGPMSHTPRDRKLELLRQFDNKFQKKQLTFQFNTLNMWRTAAVLLFLVSAGILLFNSGKRNTNEAFSQIVRDTVYVSSAVVQASQRDTVYLMRESNQGKHSYTTLRTVRSVQSNPVSTPSTDFGVLSAKDLKKTPNKQKNNSLKNDSLRSRFRFVTL